MKVLLAIMSCRGAEANGDNQAIRDTWMRDVVPHQNVDFRFFVGDGLSKYPARDIGFPTGEGITAGPDTVALAVPDDYVSLILKSQAMRQWAFERYYDFVFKADADTYVDVDQLMRSGFEKWDYFGHVHTAPGTPKGDGTRHIYGFLGGGEGYWTSRKACEEIIRASVHEGPMEDLWVGHVLGSNGIRMVDHPGYGEGITLHGSLRDTQGPYRPGFYRNSWMRKTYQERKG